MQMHANNSNSLKSQISDVFWAKYKTPRSGLGVCLEERGKGGYYPIAVDPINISPFFRRPVTTRWNTCPFFTLQCSGTQSKTP